MNNTRHLVVDYTVASHFGCRYTGCMMIEDWRFLDALYMTVESPYEMGAVSMAHHIIRPTVTNFPDLAFAHQRKGIQMEEIPVKESSQLVNVQLKDSGIRQNYNFIIIAIKKPDGNMLFNPSFEATIMPDNTVIAVGELENLKKLEKILNPLRN